MDDAAFGLILGAVLIGFIFYCTSAYETKEQRAEYVYNLVNEALAANGESDTESDLQDSDTK